jgi:rhamnogalacturonan endolyase
MVKGDPQMKVLFQDDFTAYAPADIIHIPLDKPGPHLGPWRQSSLHYTWASSRIPNWMVSTFFWSIGDDGQRRYLEMPDVLKNAVLTTGDQAWRNYELELETAWTGRGTVGVLFRYQTSRHNYRLDFVEGKKLRIVRRNDEQQVVLAESDFPHVSGEWHTVRIGVEDSHLQAWVDGVEIFDVEDSMYPHGSIGLRCEGTGRFTNVHVRSTSEEWDDLQHRLARQKMGRQSSAARYGRCVYQRTVKLPRAYSLIYPVDINRDGKTEFIGIVEDFLAPDYVSIAGIGVYDHEGRELWYSGDPSRPVKRLDYNVAFQVADINGDGKLEILYTQNFEIRIADALTGQILNSAPTPEAVKGTEDRFPRILGDSIHVCNLRGAAAGRDFLIKDVYFNLWAYTCDLKPLWHRQLNTGHYCRAADINGDGRDEIMAGYSCLDADGNTLWTVPGADPLHNRYPGSEHADSLWIGRFKEGPDAPIEIVIAASDLGFNLLDVHGNLLARDLCGHAQALSIARFRKDIPGRQFLVLDFWGNTDLGILYDCFGRRLATCEFPGLDPYPVKWDLTGEALFSSPSGGVLIDGYFNPVVEIPRAGGACPNFCDVDGDGLDEVLIRKGNDIEIWGRDRIIGRRPVPGEHVFENFSPYGAFYL